jgi:tetratricopeptide (TPR) repeat protein
MSLVALFLIGCANPINQHTAQNYNELGRQAERAGDYVLAEEYYSRALWNAKIGGLPISGVSMVSYNLGRTKGYLCKHDEAEQLLLDALRMEDELSEPEIGLITMRLLELARLVADQSRYDEAVFYYARAVPLVRELDIESEDPIGFANVLVDYSQVLKSSGNVEKAELIRQESDRIRDSYPLMRPNFVPQSYKQNCNEIEDAATTR